MRKPDLRRHRPDATVLTLEVKLTMAETLRQMATAEGTSVAALVRQMIQTYLDDLSEGSQDALSDVPLS